MEPANSHPKKATVAQVNFFKGIFARHEVTLSPTRLRRFKALTIGEASVAIERAEIEFSVSPLAGYSPPAGLATSRQLTYFLSLQKRLGNVVEPAVLDHAKSLTCEEMQLLNSQTMRELQEHNDAHGVPLPAWRRYRRLYDAEVLSEGQRAAAVRNAERRAEVQARIAARQAAQPRQAIPYPGENEKRYKKGS